LLTWQLVLPCEALHLILDYLLLLVQEVDRLVDMGVDHCWLVHVLLFLGNLHLVDLLEVLIFLSQDHILLHDLAILLRCQWHLVLLDHLLPVLCLLALSLQLDLLLYELFLLLELVRVELVGVVLLLGSSLLVGVMPGRLLLLLWILSV
jgi:hypothetical protein